ncbi:uncharacterized protein LOC110096148 [Dendrobium catenatum]|uniref:uncharacterized protein LOC110096148 n=1 Tax=Dendrobium catenatum TaxID=906689 RepID=UPI0009F4A9A6|nr:uncharacterized protein LOC110096148 [Dendrobium catenatum]
MHFTMFPSRTTVQYLNEVKSLVDQIAVAGGHIDEEDTILYILRGLPPNYQSFKASIRSMTQPLNLDQLYSFLITEEIHMALNLASLAVTDTSNAVLFSSCGRGRRSRGCSYGPTNSTKESPTNAPTCQICLKKGHTANDC